ncbi:MAG: hypothetical protein WCQ23_00675 [Candidatus Methanomethylophilaceae archaeon]|jgi:hypothetical protein
MIRLTIGECRVDILPVVQGLTPEADKVKEAYGKYEAYGLPLSVEGILALSKRDTLDMDDYEVNELDLVYAHHLSEFGNVEFPCPAFCELVDLCKNDGLNVVALDMNEDKFTDVYLENIKATEFVKEHRVAKKGMKKKFDMSSPETFAEEWDAYVNKVKGYRKLSAARERYIAEQIADLAKYRKTVLIVAEVERVKNIVDILEKQ